jgi:hypothetical protein
MEIQIALNVLLGTEDHWSSQLYNWDVVSEANHSYYTTLHQPPDRNVGLHDSSQVKRLNALHIKRICFIWLSAYRSVNTLHLRYKKTMLIQYKAKFAACFQIHAKHINEMSAIYRMAQEMLYHFSIKLKLQHHSINIANVRVNAVVHGKCDRCHQFLKWRTA